MFLSHIMGEVLIYGAGRIILNNYIRVFQKMQLTPLEVFFFWNENESLEMTVPIHKDSQWKSKNTASRCNFFLNDRKQGRGVAIYNVSSLALAPSISIQLCHITTQEQRTHHMSLLKLRKKSPNKHPASLQPQLMPGSAPSVLVWHILPHCPLEHSRSSYLLLQICPMFFPSSWSCDSSLPSKSRVYKWNHSK